MSTSDAAPRVVVVVGSGGESIVVSVGHDVPCDLDLVQRLLWLCLLARRMGWTVELEQVDDDFVGLLHLVGVACCFGLGR